MSSTSDNDPPDDDDWFLYGPGMRYEDIPAGVTRCRVADGVVAVEDDALNNKYYGAGHIIPNQTKYNALTHVRIAPSVQRIGRQAFKSCRNICTIEIPVNAELQEIGRLAFDGCGQWAGEIVLPASLQTIGDAAFSQNSLTKVVVHGDATRPSQLVSLGGFASCHCLTMVDLAHCPLLEHLRRSTFTDCTALKTILLPPNLQRIGASCFNGCTALTNIQFPPSLRGIDYNAFQGCTSITTLLFTAALRDIGRPRTFFNCQKLRVVEFQSFATIGQVMQRGGEFERRRFWDFLGGCDNLHTILWLPEPAPPSPKLWPRILVALFLQTTGIGGILGLSARTENRLSCVFSFLSNHHEELLALQGH